MGLIGNVKSWFSRKEPQNISENFDGFYDAFVKQLSNSGVEVTWETALNCSTAFACGRVISEGLAQVPFRMFVQEGRNRNPAVKNSKYKIFDTDPNELQTSFEFFEQMGLHLVFTGDFFALKSFFKGKLNALMPWNPKHVTVTSEKGSIQYFFKNLEGKLIEVPKKYVWHVKGPSWDGVKGLDIVKIARESIGLGLATEKHGSKLFKNGAAVGGILSTDQNLSKENRDVLRESWKARQTGGDNAWKTAVLWSGLKWEPQGFSNDKAQFLETRNFQVEEICRNFRVMPIMIGYSDKTSTYASAEQMFLAHSIHTMGPWYRRIEKSADKHLLDDDDKATGHYTKFVNAAMLRGSHKDRSDFYTALYNIGAMNPNEIRSLEDMNPYDDGDKYRVPLNMEDPQKPGDGENKNEN